MDQSLFIVRSIDEVQFTLLHRQTLLPIMAPYFSCCKIIVGTTLDQRRGPPAAGSVVFPRLPQLQRVVNFTFNNMTLLGLSLSVDWLIDDAFMALKTSTGTW